VIVADCNLLAYLLIPGEQSAAARRVWQRDPEWYAPPLWRSELRSVLSRYVKASDGMSLEDVVAIVEEAEGLLRGREVLPDSALVLELARGSGRSSYDCEYVATALQLDVRRCSGGVV
jgi:predicted nucleic acid-binding protein